VNEQAWPMKNGRWKLAAGLAVLAVFCMWSPAAAATQEEFFRSMQQSVEGDAGGSGSEAGRILMLLFAGAALVGLVMVLGRQQKRKTATSGGGIHSPRKLMKEISRVARVSSGEMRQLKVLADQESCTSPITLLLCPSLLVKGIQQDGKADRKVLLQLAKRMGLTKKK
jgi:hypothetical protein